MSHRDLRPSPWLCFILLIGACDAAATTRFVSPSGTCGGHSPCFSEILEAVVASAPGDTVYLFPGLYEPREKVEITVPLYLFGPQAGISPIPYFGTQRSPGNPSSEAILDGERFGLDHVVVVRANPVTINGLEIRSAVKDVVLVDGTSAESGLVLESCIVHDSRDGAAIRIQDAVGALLRCVDVFGDGVAGVVVDGGLGTSLLQCEIHDLERAESGVRLEGITGDLGNLLHDCLIHDLRIGTGVLVTPIESAGTHSYGQTIARSRIWNLGGDGITILRDHVTVNHLEIHACAGRNGGIYVDGARDALILENVIRDNSFDEAVWGNPAAIFVGPEAGDELYIIENNIQGNQPFGLTNRSSHHLIARHQWWGDVSGPSGVGPGTGDAVSENVTFEPWLSAPVDIDEVQAGHCGERAVPAQPATWGLLKSIYR